MDFNITKYILTPKHFMVFKYIQIFMSQFKIIE